MIIRVITTELGNHFAWIDEADLIKGSATYTCNYLNAPWYGADLLIELWRDGAKIDWTTIARYGTDAPTIEFTKFRTFQYANNGPVEFLSAKDFQKGDELHIAPHPDKRPTLTFEQDLWFGMMMHAKFARTLYVGQ